jgi:hypothetical protein
LEVEDEEGSWKGRRSKWRARRCMVLMKRERRGMEPI